MFLSCLATVVLLVMVGPGLSSMPKLSSMESLMKRMERQIGRIKDQMDRMESKMDRMESKVDGMESNMALLPTSLLDSIDGKFDEHSNRIIDGLLIKLQEDENPPLSSQGLLPFIKTPVISVGYSKPVNCQEYRKMGYSTSGIYEISPIYCSSAVNVWCDMVDDDGWTVILSRKEQDVPENFTRDWDSYAVGFGDPYGEYWIGNEFIHQLTKDVSTTLRVDGEDFEGNRKFGEWHEFIVGDGNSKYRLNVGRFDSETSTMGDSMLHHNRGRFSTFDEDNDTWHSGHCALTNGGNSGGWWYRFCAECTPTGLLKDTDSRLTSNAWAHWNPGTARGSTEQISVRMLIMKIKPNDSEGPVRMCQE